MRIGRGSATVFLGVDQVVTVRSDGIANEKALHLTQLKPLGSRREPGKEK